MKLFQDRVEPFALIGREGEHVAGKNNQIGFERIDVVYCLSQFLRAGPVTQMYIRELYDTKVVERLWNSGSTEIRRVNLKS